jgi:hypothetical protein
MGRNNADFRYGVVPHRGDPPLTRENAPSVLYHGSYGKGGENGSLVPFEPGDVIRPGRKVIDPDGLPASDDRLAWATEDPKDAADYGSSERHVYQVEPLGGRITGANPLQPLGGRHFSTPMGWKVIRKLDPKELQ